MTAADERMTTVTKGRQFPADQSASRAGPIGVSV